MHPLLPAVLAAAVLTSGPEPAVRAEPLDPEAAYRANNVGVGFMEQYQFEPAVASFRKAVALDPKLAMARANLGIALFYLPDLPAARKELEAAAALAPEANQAPYVLGLIARHENRLEDAEAAFRTVLQRDARDVGTNVNLGQVLLAERKYPEALPLLEAAVAAEPYNVTAVYNLGVALTRGGRAEEGAKVTARFQTLRESLYKTQMGNAYLEQGKYAETQATSGAEPGLVDTKTPAVAFADKTAAIWPAAASADVSSLSLADLDDDGRIDVIECRASGLRILRSEGATFRDVTPSWKVPPLAAVAAVAGDYDGDGIPDLLVLEPTRVRLLRNDGKTLTEVTTIAKIEALAFAPTTAAFVDVDHDGDLDLLVGGVPNPGASRGAATLRLLRNNGDSTFTDTTAAARLDAAKGRVAAVVPTDFDERRDVDLLVVYEDQAPALFKNLRDGSFQDVAGDVGLPSGGGFRAVAIADLNKDGFSDFLFAPGQGPAVLALSDGRGRFAIEPAPPGASEVRAATFFDYDRDGLVDLLVATPSGLRLFRNVSRSFTDVTEAALPKAGGGGPAVATTLQVADLDGDLAQDLLASGPGGTVRVLVNGRGPNHAFALRLAGRVSNKNGVGAKVDLRAGALRQRVETRATTPAASPADVVFGLGPRVTPDAVRILWTSGIVQTETEFGAPVPAGPKTALLVTELDRKPSSCPFLFTWNGTEFEFVTDFLGGGEMGYWLGPGERNEPDPTEYVRIRDDQLQPREGRLDLRVSNELEEVLYLDHAELLAVTHPDGVEVFPNEGMTEPPRSPRLFAVRDLRPPTAATDDDGRDALPALARLDRTYPEGFRLRPTRGYAEDHTLTLDLGGLPADHTLLVMTAWTDYAFSSDNLAAHQHGEVMKPPVLEVRGPDGGWQKAMDVGIPVGRPQTLVLDLAHHWKGPDRQVRIVTNMRIYWDQIRVGTSAGAFEPGRLPLVSSVLGERGFSAEVRPEGREPITYDYARASWARPWKVLPGRYTRLGDVRELLARTDDLFVISKPGDDLALSFDARSLPRVKTGERRTYLLYGVGYSKEMDVNSASPDVVQPIPYHGMPAYPFTQAAVPPAVAKRQAAKAAAWDTRIVGRPLPPVELAEVSR